MAGRPRLLILDGVLDALDLRECPDLVPRLFDRSAPWTLLVASANPDVIALCDRTISFAGTEPADPPLLTRQGSNR
jgi:ABC-type molybdenum transport system ATPase subunit/photorepair protein PhrA